MPCGRISIPEMSRQLSFDWPPRVTFGADAYFVSDANRAAFELVTSPDRWPQRRLVLAGPQGAGKTHLARLYADRFGARVLDGPAISGAAPLPTARKVVIEDADRLRPAAEEWLFHLHNSLDAAQGTLLLTARSAPARWTLALPDLRSRLEAIAVARIDDPDDTLLAAVLMKLFEDRQIAPDPRLVPWLLPRMKRSFEAAQDIVARLDAASLESRRPVTIPLARATLDLDGEHG